MKTAGSAVPVAAEPQAHWQAYSLLPLRTFQVATTKTPFASPDPHPLY
jgi:hypothetical protein